MNQGEEYPALRPVLFCLLKIQRWTNFLHGSHSLVSRHFTAKETNKKTSQNKSFYPALTLRERYLEVIRLMEVHKYIKSMVPLNH
jgi:hypothetical protein